MTRIGIAIYWIARGLGYFYANWYRGWRQMYRSDYDAPVEWKRK